MSLKAPQRSSRSRSRGRTCIGNKNTPTGEVPAGSARYISPSPAGPNGASRENPAIPGNREKEPRTKPNCNPREWMNPLRNWTFSETRVATRHGLDTAPETPQDEPQRNISKERPSASCSETLPKISKIQIQLPPPPETFLAALTHEKFGLFVLKDQDPNAKDIVNIIAIHGLGGDAHETWTAPNKKLWLRDFLPHQIPNARIMTFGYDSSWLFSKNVMSITDFANDLLFRLKNDRHTPIMRKQPIIFVCHSLGGIIAKRAITLAYENSTLYGELLSQIKGVVFLGTPHRGSHAATIANIASSTVNYLLPGQAIKKPLMKALSTNSNELEEISRSFLARTSLLKIASFCEADAFPGLPFPLSPKEYVLSDTCF
ncbi:uncharacterized protein N7483_011928 [Penicillium malachiteum]|uniref:uncharacterized protein n=1 Tax=Penicillium malachiteum TaxID=1324776 RepID=UPI002546BD82|nr:uncharacterized protein N7483_011928 [Penicillium malachiteum]KAJ5714747.1 hypothetical protein N7483_011928 [Penicillium malachiteum]